MTLRYENDKPVAVDAVVLSTQHSPDVPYKTLQEAVMDEIILHVLPKEWIHKDTKFHINPTGQFVIGGPVGDCGLTGRKIIVDTYGGMGRHGGGAFSGKDPSKVDRSAAYAGRYVAKNIVAAGLADRCEIQISYAIGVAEPTSIEVDTFGTGRIAEERIVQLVREHFDLRPKGLIAALDLLRPIYRPTAPTATSAASATTSPGNAPIKRPPCAPRLGCKLTSPAIRRSTGSGKRSNALSAFGRTEKPCRPLKKTMPS